MMVVKCPPRTRKLQLRLATPEDRDDIYRLRHAVYAEELGQHRVNDDGRLIDAIDDVNEYLVARDGDQLAGCVSITPPGSHQYSVEKYFRRDQIPLRFDRRLFEIRLLTVHPDYRGSMVAFLLMYAALRFVQEQGGEQIVAFGRREVIPMYRKAGLRPLGLEARSGRVDFEVLAASIDEIQPRVAYYAGALNRMRALGAWELDIPVRPPPACYHGGAFFKAIGEDFSTLEKRHEIIGADVLDAWFDPSPQVLQALTANLPWLLKTSPPTGCDGMIQGIAAARGVPAASILPGAGSSDLIFLALRQFVHADSRVLILDPMYGEYAHVLERVIGCTVDRLRLRRDESYDLNLSVLRRKLESGYDWCVLVNPNSPTGRYTPFEALAPVLARFPATNFWLDETYIEYTGGRSFEATAAASDNVFVCKSMSKVFGLSGVRAAYLCGPQHAIGSLRALNPPWAVSLPGQLAAVEALKDRDYYAARYRETHAARLEVEAALRDDFGLEVIPGIANFVLAHIHEDGPTAAEVVTRCRREGVYLRDAAAMGTALGDRAIRIAIKDRATNARILKVLKSALDGLESPRIS